MSEPSDDEIEAADAAADSAAEPDERLRHILARFNGTLARPKKFTPAVGNAILRGVAKGYPLETAGRLAGVLPDTLREWLRESVRAREPLKTFYHAVQDAIAGAEADDLDAIASMPKGWQARAWLLEKRQPLKYGARAQLDVNHTYGVDRLDERPIAETLAKLAEVTDSAIRKRLSEGTPHGETEGSSIRDSDASAGSSARTKGAR